MEQLMIGDLNVFKEYDYETLRRYNSLGMIESIKNNALGGITIECKNGMLVMDRNGYEEAFVTNEDNPFIY